MAFVNRLVADRSKHRRQVHFADGNLDRLEVGTAVGAFYIANRTVDIASLGLLQPVTVALFVYGAAYALPEPKQLPDVSYGIYVWHGPVIQFALLLGLMLNLWIACAATLIMAALGWYVVEKPAIGFARKLTGLVEKRSDLSLSRRAG